MIKILQKPFVWGITVGLSLVASASYILLDTFVIPQGQRVVTATQNQRQEEVSSLSSELSTGEVELTDTTYSDDNMTITIQTLREYDTDIYVAEIVTSDPSLLKTAFAQNTYGRNVTAQTSEMASSTGVNLAINGDYYGFRQQGYVVRNGEIYRDTARTSGDTEALVIDDNGQFTIIDETETSLSSLDTDSISQILSFGPALVNNGQIVVDEDTEISGRSKGNQNPRTAIGMVAPGHYYLIVADGRSDESVGLTLAQLANVFTDLGVQVAYNLDGGGSSTMVFNGQLVNNPTTNGRSVSEREVSDIVYFGY